MTEFSSLELPILAPGANQTLDLLATIDRQAQATVQDVGKAVTVTAEQMRAALQQTNGDLQKAAQIAVQGTQQAAQQATQAAAANTAATVQRTAGAVDRVVGVTARRQAVALRQISYGVSNIAMTTERTWGGALRGIIGQTADIAFGFGMTGPIVAAIAVTGLALFGMWQNQQKQIRETARVAAAELRTLAQSGSLGSLAGKYGAATMLFSGDQYAVRGEKESDRAFEARQIGIQGVRGKITGLQARIDANQGGGAIAQSIRQNALNQIREWERELEQLVPRYEKLIALTNELAADQGRIAASNVEELRAGGQAVQDKVLDNLLSGGIPQTSVTGRTINAANMIELRERMLTGIQKSLKPADLGPSLARTAVQTQALEEWNALAEQIGTSFGMTLGDAIANGIATAVQSGDIGAGFRAMTGGILIGLGQMMQQIGTQTLLASKLMMAIKAALMAFNPAGAIVGSLLLIAAGGVVQGLGAAMGGRGSGGGGYGGTSGGLNYGTVINRGLVNPANGVVTSPGVIRPRESVTFAPTIIGGNDPRAQREIYEMWDKGRRRQEG